MKLIALALLIPILAQQAKGPAPSREAEFKKAVAAAWEKLATWCAERKLPAEARAAAELALAADPGNAKAAALKGLEGESGATEADAKEHATRLAATRKQVSATWRQLAAQPHEDKEDSRYDEYWALALELDPKAVQPLYDAEWRAALAKDWKRAARMLSREEGLLGSDPVRSKTLKDLEAKHSTAEPVLKKATTHEIRYFLSLPKGWAPGRTWPVLVVVDGAGSSFEAQCRRHAGFRGEVPVILVAPCTFANTNALNKDKYPWYPPSLLDEVDKSGRLAWDDAGLLAVLEDVKREYGGEERFFITGYSGGGNLTWWNVFSRPARLRGAFPACANFYQLPKEPPEGGRDVPVRAFQGDKDGHLEMLTDQWNRAEKTLKEWGYTNYSRQLLPGVGHTACHKEVYLAIQEILAKK